MGREDKPLRGQVADGSVEHLQSEQLLDQGVVFHQRSLQRVDHVVLVDQTTLAGKVLVNNRQYGQDIPSARRFFEQFVVDPKDSDQELPCEWKVKFGVFSDELGDD